MEKGKVVEWEAPCHQYALIPDEVEEEDVSGSDKNRSRIEFNHTDGERKNNWKVAELEKDQVAFMVFSLQESNSSQPHICIVAGGACLVKLEVWREGTQ